MALPVLFTAESSNGVDVYDVALSTAFEGHEALADLELNPGGQEAPTAVALTRADARVLRDALDALLGERRATIPDGFSGTSA